VTEDLRALYDETILEHSRRPRNLRVLADGVREEQHNPLCGDRITIYVRLTDTMIGEIGFDGSACAIAIASASLMTEAVSGRTREDASALAERVERMVGSPPGRFVDLDGLSALAALSGVRQFPIRLKCALLPWLALRRALDRARTCG
jgi:nitrogen fixation NifU-like protein